MYRLLFEKKLKLKKKKTKYRQIWVNKPALKGLDNLELQTLINIFRSFLNKNFVDILHIQKDQINLKRIQLIYTELKILFFLITEILVKKL